VDVGVEHAVEDDARDVLVVLVLVPLTLQTLDDGVDHVRRVRTGLDVFPQVDHAPTSEESSKNPSVSSQGTGVRGPNTTLDVSVTHDRMGHS
jgi:hypothetical protein